jgi:serine-type D-Ala-D-Ala endopeptidase (penicillin-binding protein 7)
LIFLVFQAILSLQFCERLLERMNMLNWKRCTQALAVVVLGASLSVTSVQAAPGGAKQVAAQKKKVQAVKRPVVRKKLVAAKVVAQGPALAKSKRGLARPQSVVVTKVPSVIRLSEHVRPTVGEKMGLGEGSSPVNLSSRVAFVVDQNTQEVLISKNDTAVLPIASITKLMTGLLVADAKLSMDEEITITMDDVDTIKGSGSRLAVGTRLSRGEAMHLALMSSENRAAHALGRTYPGGLTHFVGLMNQKAKELGMNDSRFIEPTGLSSSNQSSARDLAALVNAAYQRPLIRNLSTSPSYSMDVGRRTLQYRNSNRLIDNPDWDIGLQKTGYIAEAGRCLVMQVSVAGRQLIMVFLDAAGKAARLGDAERVRRWVETTFASPAQNHFRNG